jgi:glutathione S-transferase
LAPGDRRPRAGQRRRPIPVFESGAILLYLAQRPAASAVPICVAGRNFPNVKRWFEAIAAMPATYEKGEAVNDSSVAMSDEAKKMLFGQTAATR